MQLLLREKIWILLWQQQAKSPMSVTIIWADAFLYCHQPSTDTGAFSLSSYPKEAIKIDETHTWLSIRQILFALEFHFHSALCNINFTVVVIPAGVLQLRRERSPGMLHCRSVTSCNTPGPHTAASGLLVFFSHSIREISFALTLIKCIYSEQNNGRL